MDDPFKSHAYGALGKYNQEHKAMSTKTLCFRLIFFIGVVGYWA